MKKYLAYVLVAAGLMATACNNEDQLTLNGEPTHPEITSDIAASSVLELKDINNVWGKVEWTPADYGLAVAANYKIEVALKKNETDSAETVVKVEDPHAASEDVTVGELNAALIELGVVPEQEAEVNIFVVSEVLDIKGTAIDGQTLVSKVKTIKVTPFKPLNAVPNHIFKVGTESGWANDNDTAFPLYELKKGVFTGNFYLKKDEQFKILSTPGSWDGYGFNELSGGAPNSCKENGGNIQFTGETGMYQVTIDTNAKTLKINADDVVALYKVGSENDWNDSNKPGFKTVFPVFNLYGAVFSAVVELKKGEDFKFVSKLGDWGDQVNGGNFATKPKGFSGDDNIHFDGTSGQYRLTIDRDKGTFEAEAL